MGSEIRSPPQLPLAGFDNEYNSSTTLLPGSFCVYYLLLCLHWAGWLSTHADVQLCADNAPTSSIRCRSFGFCKETYTGRGRICKLHTPHSKAPGWIETQNLLAMWWGNLYPTGWYMTGTYKVGGAKPRSSQEKTEFHFYQQKTSLTLKILTHGLSTTT